MKKILSLLTCALLALALVACGEQKENAAAAGGSDTAASTAPAENSAPLRLLALMPATTTERTAFNVQPDGTSAIALATENATNKTVLVFGGRSITPVFGNPKLLSATIPEDLYATPGSVKVYLMDGSRMSNELEFAITPKGAPAAQTTTTTATETSSH